MCVSGRAHRPADKHEHEVKIDDEESVLAWQFKTENHNIGFAVFRKLDNNAVSRRAPPQRVLIGVRAARGHSRAPEVRRARRSD